MAAAGLVQAVEDIQRARGVAVGERDLLPRLAVLDAGGSGKGVAARFLPLMAPGSCLRRLGLDGDGRSFVV